MKRFIFVFLAVVMCVSLCACGKSTCIVEGCKNKKTEDATFGNEYCIEHLGFEKTKTAFLALNEAANILDEISADVLSAWDFGISNERNIKDYSDGFLYFGQKGPTHLSWDELHNALASLEYKSDDNPMRLSYYVENVLARKNRYWSNAIENRNNSVFSACVDLTVEAYIQNGDLLKVEGLLETAQKNVLDLSENHSDYTHFNDIKKYYDAVNLCFNFCVSPSGSLSLATENVNNYNSIIDESYNSLYYFFEDSAHKLNETVELVSDVEMDYIEPEGEMAIETSYDTAVEIEEG